MIVRFSLSISSNAQLYSEADVREQITLPWAVVGVNILSLILMSIMSCISCCGAYCNTPARVSSIIINIELCLIPSNWW